MQIEDVSGKGFAPGRTLQDEGDLPVGDRVLGKVVVDDEGVLAVPEEPFAHGASRIRG